MIILIPARKGSKGLLNKNRKLLDYTLSSIPKELLKHTYVSTNDKEISSRASKICNVHNRSERFAADDSSTLSLVQEFRDYLELGPNEILVLLYLTYPQRSFSDVVDAYNLFKKKRLDSLLCKKEPLTHPHLCMYEMSDGKGSQVVQHNLYRRQDYPKVFEISHYISIFRVDEIRNLNSNLYNNDTFFYGINEKIDIDTQSDLDAFLR